MSENTTKLQEIDWEETGLLDELTECQSERCVASLGELEESFAKIITLSPTIDKNALTTVKVLSQVLVSKLVENNVYFDQDAIAKIIGSTIVTLKTTDQEKILAYILTVLKFDLTKE